MQFSPETTKLLVVPRVYDTTQFEEILKEQIVNDAIVYETEKVYSKN